MHLSGTLYDVKSHRSPAIAISINKIDQLLNDVLAMKIC